MLLQLWEKSLKKHVLSHEANQADLVLVTDITGPNWFYDLRKNQSIKDASKSFVIADGDIPMPLLHGIYTSNHKNLKFQFRFRTGAYNLFAQQVQNPFVAQDVGESYTASKKFLYSFVGQDSSSLRLKLFLQQPKRQDVLILNMTSFFNAYNHKENHLQYQKKYCDIMRSSKFVLCPKGTSGASIRLFEAMKMGVAPVIISDDWILPRGPSWNDFALIIKEADFNRIDEIIEVRAKDYVAMGRKANEAYQKFFADDVYFDYVIDQLIDIKKYQKIPEWLFWNFRNIVVWYWKAEQRWQFLKKLFTADFL